MAEIYTEDLIRFIYNETTPEETNEISIALRSNNSLRVEYDKLKDTVCQLDSASLLPHPSSIAIIMEESNKRSAELAH